MPSSPEAGSGPTESGGCLHQHILIPTDGSELSQKAIDYGMALAKSVNAKVTVLTVSIPFYTLAVEPGMITDTPELYGKRMATVAAKYLNVANEAALAAGVSCDTTRQITEAFPWDTVPTFLIRDNDGAYGEVFTRRLRTMGIRDRPIAPRSPWQNGYVERLIGTIRRECLDHIIA